MRRRALRPFGLRSRLLLALVVTALATLLVAALALFSPLQDRLRRQQAAGLSAATLNSKPQVEAAITADLKESPRVREFGPVYTALELISGRTRGEALVTDARGRVLVSTEARLEGDLTDVLQVLGSNRTVRSRRGDSQRIATPLGKARRPRLPAGVRDVRRPFYVLAVRQRDTDVSETVGVVRQAFITAAVAGLAVALLLGLFLTRTLTRRLGRLRDAAVRITREGMDAPAPTDTTDDEVGDLGRAMAQMQEGLRRQEGARRQFVATASHELRTPLTSLSGNLELLGEDLADEGFDREDARRQVTAAQGEIRRLRNLATELLDLSRLDAGVELRSEPVELGEIARAVAAEFALQAHERRTLVEVVPPRGPCWARGDPDAVARVARILLDNALRYTPASTAVQVTTGYAGETAVLTVVDDGPGVPPEEHATIFERFRRGTSTRGEGGFGLGLAIGRELAERLDGRLELQSRPAGGARFLLVLPIELPAGGLARG